MATTKTRSMHPDVGIVDDTLIKRAIESERRMVDKETQQKYEKDDPQAAAVKTKWDVVHLATTEALALSFKNIIQIDNLATLDTLLELRLDNNRITRIENLSHLKNLRWLDLSFNRIEVIEGLSQLHKLRDLTLFNNRIEEVRGLSHLTELEVLSLGNNRLADFEDAAKNIRAMKALRVLTVDGNPMADSPECRTRMLAFAPHLHYIDYSRVTDGERQAAAEAHQSDILALEDSERVDQDAERAERQLQARVGELEAGGLLSVHEVHQRMCSGDKEGARLQAIPGSRDVWRYFEADISGIVEDVLVQGLELHEEQCAERDAIVFALQQTRDARDGHSMRLVKDYSRKMKRLRKRVVALANDSDDEIADASETKHEVLSQLRAMATENTELLTMLTGEEVALNEDAAQVLDDFDTKFAEIAAKRADLIFSKFFRSVERVTEEFKDKVMTQALAVVERIADGDAMADDLADELMGLLVDREAVISAVNSSHDYHVEKLLACEDEARKVEKRRERDFLTVHVQQEGERNRKRLAEIQAIHERNERDLKELGTVLASLDDSDSDED